MADMNPKLLKVTREFYEKNRQYKGRDNMLLVLNLKQLEEFASLIEQTTLEIAFKKETRGFNYKKKDNINDYL